MLDLQILEKKGIKLYSAADACGAVSFLKAPFEADPVLVSFAAAAGNRGAIVSPDGDTLCYTGGLLALVSAVCLRWIGRIWPLPQQRILRVNWSDPKLSAKITTKQLVLDHLDLRQPQETSYNQVWPSTVHSAASMYKWVCYIISRQRQDDPWLPQQAGMIM